MISTHHSAAPRSSRHLVAAALVTAAAAIGLTGTPALAAPPTVAPAALSRVDAATVQNLTGRTMAVASFGPQYARTGEHCSVWNADRSRPFGFVRSNFTCDYRDLRFPGIAGPRANVDGFTMKSGSYRVRFWAVSKSGTKVLRFSVGRAAGDWTKIQDYMHVVCSRPPFSKEPTCDVLPVLAP